MENQNLDHFWLSHQQPVHAEGESYKCQRRIGAGGNGVVFLVTCVSGKNKGLQFVLKVFYKISDDKRREAFLREIEILQDLNHPGIVNVFDRGEFTVEDRSYPFAITEYAPKTLRDLMREGAVDRMRALRISLNCLSGLVYLHSDENQIVHRDIKPSNILLSKAVAKIADLGLAKELSEEDADMEAADDAPSRVMMSSQWPAMPKGYRTPELIERARGKDVDITPASDIFQMGSILYEMLTEYNPQNFVEDITDDLTVDIRYIDGVQGGLLRELIESMLDMDPEERPSAEDCLNRLTHIHEQYCRDLRNVTGQQV